MIQKLALGLVVVLVGVLGTLTVLAQGGGGVLPPSKFVFGRT